jgi:hypothetical protein
LASDDFIVGWAVEIDSDGRSALQAFDGNFNFRRGVAGPLGRKRERRRLGSLA